MIDHVSIAVSDLARSAAFFDRALAPLGYRRMVERAATVGYGRTHPELWLNARPRMATVGDDTGAHVCLRAPSEEAVRAFHAAAIAAGGRCDGAPGHRQGALTVYFAAFIRDLDGNKVEAITFPRS